MERRPGKYIIGFTGSIGTGKSVVRRMLEHLGGLGIDADALAHRVYARGTPGFEQILQVFGKEVLADDGEVDRQKLAKVVFGNPQALATLEAIVHPLVIEVVNRIITRAVQPVVIIEAIKLLESELARQCDAIWVVSAAPEVQLSRLVQIRGMSEQAARARIDSQVPQESRLARASVVIHNDGSFKDTWQQVKQAWETTIPPELLAELGQIEPVMHPCEDVAVVIANPIRAGEIAAFINQNPGNAPEQKPEDILVLFGQQSFLLLEVGDEVMGTLGWKTENLVALGLNFLIDPLLPLDESFTVLIKGMERQASLLQCEASLVFLQQDLKNLGSILKEMGYKKKSPGGLKNFDWREAAEAFRPAGSQLFFKQLSGDFAPSSI